MLAIDPHPLLDLRAFASAFPRPLGEMPSPPELLALLSLDAAAPLRSDATLPEAVRAHLRHGRFRPAARSKPASEYLPRPLSSGQLASITLPLDVCNIEVDRRELAAAD